MTQLRKTSCPHCGGDLNPISNYFDDLVRGLGKRGSTFTDVDAVTHDKDTRRFLFQEFRNPGERLHPAQAMVLNDLAGLDRCTVWFVRRAGEGVIGWMEYRPGAPQHEELITEAEYQGRFVQWWNDGAATVKKAS